MVEIDKELTRAAGEKIEEEKKIEIERKKKDTTDAIKKRQKRQEAFLQSLEGGVSVLKASKAAVIDYKTIWRWRKEDEEFNDKVTAIIDSRVMIVEDALFLNAAKGNLGAQIFWLINRSQGRWKNKREEDITLTHQGGIDFTEYKKIKEMNADERKAIIKGLSEIIRSRADISPADGPGGNTKESVVTKENNIS